MNTFTRIRPTRLINFRGDRAELHRDGKAFEAVQIGRCWYLKGSYRYLETSKLESSTTYPHR